MDIIDIIKESFVFPSKNMKLFLIFVLLTLIAGVFSLAGAISYVLGFINPEFFMWGGIAIIVSVLIGWVLSGYSISFLKSGIELKDEAPGFEWWDNFNNGFNYFIVTIVYYIIPAFLVVVVGFITNVFGNIYIVYREIFAQVISVYSGASSIVVSDALTQAMANLMVSLAVTGTVAVVLFVIFSFLQIMAGARLANTGSLTEALNVAESARDIRRIGIGKVIALILLVIIICGIIGIIVSSISNYIPILSILSIIVNPYLILFTQRAVGLLYSDIA